MDLYLGGSYSWSLKTGYPLLLVTVHPALPVATKSSLLMPQNEARHLERGQNIESLFLRMGNFFLTIFDVTKQGSVPNLFHFADCNRNFVTCCLVDQKTQKTVSCRFI